MGDDDQRRAGGAGRKSQRFEDGVGRIMANIDYWREAPLWDTASIAKATQTWFKFMDNKDGARGET